MVPYTHVLKKTTFLLTPKRFLKDTVKIFMEINTRKILYFHLAVNVSCMLLDNHESKFQVPILKSVLTTTHDRGTYSRAAVGTQVFCHDYITKWM